MSDIDSAAQRLADYVADLDARHSAQIEWHRSHPDWPTCMSINHETPIDVQEQHAVECPSTRDMVTSERFADMIRVIVAAYRRAAQ